MNALADTSLADTMLAGASTPATARSWALGGAVTLTGLYAGLYFAFAVAVMPGLARTGDATFVETMRAINQAILNPVFMLVFLGAPALTVAALVTGAGAHRPWLVAAVVLQAATFLVTVAANVPLNDALEAAGRHAAGVAHARRAFEHPWVAWNVVRTITTAGALGCLARVGL